MKQLLLYDGTFEGFLTCIFYAFEMKLKDVSIQNKNTAANTFFSTSTIIEANNDKALRVWKGLKKNASATGYANIYRAFLSEMVGIEDTLFYYIKLIFKSKTLLERKMLDKNFTDPQLLKISKVVKMVRREKHRMDAFIRFRLTKDGIYFATIEPDFNVLPLNLSHFKNRYADQKWLIYDLKRNYGIYYNLKSVEFIEISLEKNINKTSEAFLYFTEEESQYQELWKNYFSSTTIASRKNMRLHLRHVPKRYWKYLSEKQPEINSSLGN